MYNFNRFEDRANEHRAFDGREGFGGGRNRFHHDGGPFGQGEPPFGAMPNRRHGGPFGPDLEDPERGFHTMPRGFGPGPGMPPHGMPPRHGRPDMPGGHGGPGGRPPRRPSPDFLRRRIDEADLMELLDMAGRMLHRRPQGGPAQGQALVLSILAGREALSQRELQQMLGIQPGSLSELVSKLEAKGYIRREKGEDRRGNLLRITDAGREAIARQAEPVPESDPFAPLTAEQQDQLSAMLRQLLNQWVKELDAAPNCQKPIEV